MGTGIGDVVGLKVGPAVGILVGTSLVSIIGDADGMLLGVNSSNVVILNSVVTPSVKEGGPVGVELLLNCAPSQASPTPFPLLSI